MSRYKLECFDPIPIYKARESVGEDKFDRHWHEVNEATVVRDGVGKLPLKSLSDIFDIEPEILYANPEWIIIVDDILLISRQLKIGDTLRISGYDDLSL